MKNKKGFTLVELLAVIVMISILVIFAIVAVTRYVEHTRTTAFVEDAKTIATAVRSNYASGDIEQLAGVTETVSKVSYSGDAINNVLNKNLGKSSFQSNYVHSGMVIVKLDGEDNSKKYDYFVCLIDEAGHGFNYVKLEDLDEEHFSTDLQGSDCTNIYTVGLKVKNGKPTSKSMFAKQGETVQFNVTSNNPNAKGLVNCTNNQNGTLNGNVFKVENVTNDTTCTISYAIDVTPPSSTTKIYNGEEQESGITCPEGTVATGVQRAKNVGDYEQVCNAPDGYRWTDNTTGEKRISWKIIKRNITVEAREQRIDYLQNISQSTDKVYVAGMVNTHSVSEVILTPSTTDVTSNGKITPGGVKIKDEQGVDVTDNYNINYRDGKLVINPIKCLAPRNVNISTGGILTFIRSDNCSTGRHLVRIGNGNYTEATWQGDYFNSLISGNDTSKKVYMKVEGPNPNYINSDSVDINVSFVNVSFNSDDNNRGTVSPSSVKTISNSELIQSGNNLEIKGNTTGTSYKTIATVVPTPKEGYSFNKWSKANIKLTTNDTITASWIDKPIRIYYSQNGGTIVSDTGYQNYNNWLSNDGSSYFYQTVVSGSSTDLYNYNNSSGINITKSGYVALSGNEWCTKSDGTGTCFNQDTTYTYDQFKAATTEKSSYYELDLYVNWKPKPVYVYYHPNGGSIGGSTYTAYNGWVSKTGSSYFYQSIESGVTIDLYDVASFSITRSSYIPFVGKQWCNSTNGTGTCFEQNTKYTYDQYKAAANSEKATNYELDLRVNWDQVYTITYNENGGSGAPGSQSYTYDPSNTNATINLSSTKPTRSGYDFLGWSLSNTATSASYIAGQAWKRSNRSNYLLYAVWRIGAHVHDWTYVGSVDLYVGGEYEIGGSWPNYARGLYCSKCHISAWCYAYESNCGNYRWSGNYGFAGGTLYSRDYLPSGMTGWTGEPSDMTFSKYQNYEGVYKG